MVGDILQPTHLIFILIVALVVLGPKRLPEVGRSLGRGIRDFRGALTGEDHSPVHSVPSYDPPSPAAVEPAAEPSPGPDTSVVPPPHESATTPGPAQPAPATGQPAPASSQPAAPADEAPTPLSDSQL
ncbi:MAG: twin-arginine translocase TatA/TatE family subunit [Solirubrobacteraceae bacterium]